MTAVWLGVMIGLAIQTSFLTPPFGFALFYLRGVASDVVKTLDIYRGVVPFIGLQLLGLVIVGFYPPLLNYLPVRTYLTSETAPPPETRSFRLVSKIISLPAILKTGLRWKLQPPVLLILICRNCRRKLPRALPGRPSVMSVFGRVEAIRAAEAIVDEASVSYQPIHSEVRTIERDIRRLERERLQIERYPRC